MPEDKNILYRYKLLNECLSDRSKYYNIDDIVRYCNSKLFSDGFKGISKRTIQYDMNRIECLYGLEIDRDFKFNGRTCYRYKDKGASIPGFNVEDKDLVKMRCELERLNDVFRKLERFEGI